MGSNPQGPGRVRIRVPQPIQFAVKLGQTETERDEHQGITSLKEDPSPEIADVERKESPGRNAMALPHLLQVPARPLDDGRFVHSNHSKRRDELLADFGREREKLGVRLLGALEAERHGPFTRAAFGFAR